ncbi:(2Fe-2S)-binding protein [Kitasatospora kazusensis]|uniref:(2Fe-2S)-binding protein n=1 Tax=Kitasatospora kazusensis TaxID=407974 RepID=A0ABN2Z0R6_9ACTN
MLRTPVAPPAATAVQRRLAAVCGALRVHLLAAGQSSSDPGPGWLPVSELPSRTAELVRGEAARIEAGNGVAPRVHVAASRLLHHYLWSGCLLFSGPWYLAGQVPVIRPEDLWIHTATGDLALRPGGLVPGTAADLRDAVVEHLTPVLDAFGPHVKRGPRALWGMAADDLLSGIWYLGRMLGEEERAVRVATDLLPGGTPPFPGTAAFRRLTGTEGRTHLTRTRLGCCLYYAIRPAEACVTCPRTDDPERVRRLEL